MFINNLILMIITAIIMIFLMLMNIQPLLAAAITVLIVMIGYISIAFIRAKKRLNLLDYECDPEAFCSSGSVYLQLSWYLACVSEFCHLSFSEKGYSGV